MLVRDARLAAIVAARDALAATRGDCALLADFNRQIHAYLMRNNGLPFPSDFPSLLDDDEDDEETSRHAIKRRRRAPDSKTLALAELEREINMLRPLVLGRAHGILRDADAALVVVDLAQNGVDMPNDDQCTDGRVGILQRVCRKATLDDTELRALADESCPICLESLGDLLERKGELVRVDPACAVCTGLRLIKHPPACQLAKCGACITCASTMLALAWQQRDDALGARETYKRHGSGVPCPLCRGTICEDDLVIVTLSVKTTID